jgi:hypothetical protein
MAVGSVAGIVKEASELLIPEAIRHTRLYQVLLNKNLRYLIQRVGAVEGVYPDKNKTMPKYVARKFVGNFVEVAGILTLRASPVWVLALLSDISGGTKVYLKELAGELRRKGLLGEESPVDSIDQLLDGLQLVSGKIADHIDTPPLSVDELRETLKYLREDAQAIKLKGKVDHEELDSMLLEMKEVAKKEKKSLYEISTAMAMNAFNQLDRSGRTAVTGLQVGRALVDRTILAHYGRALKGISQEGYYRYLSRSSRPYLRAMTHHLSHRNITWTERYFLGKIGPMNR